jgi:hypothetical protein
MRNKLKEGSISATEDPFEESTWEVVITILILSVQLAVAGIVFYLALRHPA